MSRLSAFTLFALFARLTSATLYESVSSLPSTNFDYIIVGGGTAGCVLANRLSEDGNVKVLLLEAGGNYPQQLEVPFASIRSAGFGSQWDWNYTTTSGSPYGRGYVLGGSSSVNGMFYARGSKEDWDRYATFTKDDNWKWDNLQPYFKRNEDLVPPADGRDTTGQYDPSVHSTTGRVGVSLPGFTQSIDQLVLDTIGNDQFPFKLDYNDGVPLGFGWVQSSIKKGARSSAATAYLDEETLKRNNLHVLIHAKATRVLPSGDKTKLTASREVVLSAGVIGTPYLLLSSGIGDGATLSSLNIPVIKDLPDVGKKFSDHLNLLNAWALNVSQPFNAATSTTFEKYNLDSTQMAVALEQWRKTRTGPLAMNGLSDHVGFLRVSDGEALASFGDPAPGPNSPHYGYTPINGWAFGKPPTNNSYLSIVATVLHTKSRGSVTLDPSNPAGNPIIDTGIRADPFDVFAMRDAIKSIFKFIEAAPWVNYLNNSRPLASLQAVIDASFSDNALNSYIASSTSAGLHGISTASMAPADANWGVVNPDLTVKGLKGLRIADASVLPFLPSGNPMAPVYIVGERAADFIKASN
ncbi:hypothetical protein VNI00_011936 [Paramarasmius palmivorus]|uniref:Uncharacterized protein n=1 Tax=Paramarasmius palmivorus TaxID=297713 RepID=A0AAW0C9N3_9AGAR